VSNGQQEGAMAMSVGRPRNGAIAEINVTPMADVMIVLLIIFMVTTPIIAGAPVRLPGAAHALERKGERLEIVIRADGGVLLAGAAVPIDGLRDWIALEAGAGRATVLVQADRAAPYADVSRVLAACRTAGVTEIALATERRAGR
jgi:biopolymer transport protein ExbD